MDRTDSVFAERHLVDMELLSHDSGQLYELSGEFPSALCDPSCVHGGGGKHTRFVIQQRLPPGVQLLGERDATVRRLAEETIYLDCDLGDPGHSDFGHLYLSGVHLDQ